MIKHTSLSFRILSIAVIGALLITGCNGSVSIGGELGLDGGDGGDGGNGGSSISQNQLLVVLMIVLLVVALVGILR